MKFKNSKGYGRCLKFKDEYGYTLRVSSPHDNKSYIYFIVSAEPVSDSSMPRDKAIKLAKAILKELEE